MKYIMTHLITISFFVPLAIHGVHNKLESFLCVQGSQSSCKQNSCSGCQAISFKFQQCGNDSPRIRSIKKTALSSFAHEVLVHNKNK